MRAADKCCVPLCAQLPGVVAFIGPDDVPKGGHNEVFDDLIFAEGRVHYVGQRLGLIVAASQVRALAGRTLSFTLLMRSVPGFS